MTAMSASTVVTLDAAAHGRFVDVLDDHHAARTGTISLLYPLTLSSGAFEQLVGKLLADAEAPPAVVHISRGVAFGASPPVGAQLDITVEATALARQVGGAALTLRTSVSLDGAAVLVATDRALVVGPVPIDEFGEEEPPAEARRARLRSAATIDVPTDIGPRWADVSGDHQAIHLDDDLARSFGFERAIAHGAYTVAAALRSIVHHAAEGEPRRVRSVRCSFARPVYPGDSLRLDLSEPSAGLIDFRASARGKPVLRSGSVELSGCPHG